MHKQCACIYRTRRRRYIYLSPAECRWSFFVNAIFVLEYGISFLSVFRSTSITLPQNTDMNAFVGGESMRFPIDTCRVFRTGVPGRRKNHTKHTQELTEERFERRGGCFNVTRRRPYLQRLLCQMVLYTGTPDANFSIYTVQQ